MIKTYELLCVGAVVETVGNSQEQEGIVVVCKAMGLICRGNCETKLAWGAVAPSEGGINHCRNRQSCDCIEDAKVSCPSIINNAHPPEAMMCISPPLEDDQAI